MLRSAYRVSDGHLLGIDHHFRRSQTGKNHMNIFSRAVWKNNQKLITSDSDRHIAGANSLLQLAGKHLQSGVTGGVSKLIINFLEMIQVENYDRKRIATFLGAG